MYVYNFLHHTLLYHFMLYVSVHSIYNIWTTEVIAYFNFWNQTWFLFFKKKAAVNIFIFTIINKSLNVAQFSTVTAKFRVTMFSSVLHLSNLFPLYNHCCYLGQNGLSREMFKSLLVCWKDRWS